jgi:3',5'-cyclic AMP phosphodiesterase CpdA
LANWDAVVRYVDDTRPDLVVHVGDLTLNGAHDPVDLDDARASLDRLRVPWLAVPGNHDIGDNPWSGRPEDDAVTPERLGRWLEVIGPDRWSSDVGTWTVLAINAQLLGSDLDAEVMQWQWLDGQLRTLAPDRTVVFVLHKPVLASDAEMAAAPPYRFVLPEARSRLTALVHQQCVPLVLSGHVHQFRALRLDGRQHVWAPTTWAVLPEEVQPTFGAKRCGILSIELPPDGEAGVTLVEPTDLTQLTLTRDIADPYQY